MWWSAKKKPNEIGTNNLDNHYCNQNQNEFIFAVHRVDLLLLYNTFWVFHSMVQNHFMYESDLVVKFSKFFPVFVRFLGTLAINVDNWFIIRRNGEKQSLISHGAQSQTNWMKSFYRSIYSQKHRLYRIQMISMASIFSFFSLFPS